MRVQSAGAALLVTLAAAGAYEPPEEFVDEATVVELYGDAAEDQNTSSWGPAGSGVVGPRRPPGFDLAAGGMSEEAQRAAGRDFEAAVKAGDAAAVARLLDAGFDVEAGALHDVRRLGYTPLVNAVVYRRAAVLRLLLARGADPDIRTVWLTSPLSIAAHCKPGDAAATEVCVELVDILLAAGADVDGRTDDGWTPLFHAARARNLKIIDQLLAAGANETIRETFNNEAPGEGPLRDYVDHAALRSRADWAECRRGSPAVKRDCAAVRAWAADKAVARDAAVGAASVAAGAGAAKDEL